VENRPAMREVKRRSRGNVQPPPPPVLPTLGEGAALAELLARLGPTERQAIEQELARLAFVDPLTGLANRALFMQRLNQACTRATTEGSGLAVLFIDLDNFKRVNDSLGHAWGDHVLLTVAARLRGALRATDTAARLGGDEFTVLIEDVESPSTAIAIAERIAQLLREPIELQGRPFFIGGSVGIALGGSNADAPAELLRKADVAMYRSKTTGKGRSCVYGVHDVEQTASLLPRLELESDLRVALVRNELRLHYQPIVALQSGVIRAVEALLRWEHPRRGMISPAEFIPVAEETGLIVELGQWVVEQACAQAVAWRAALPERGAITMCVNLSPRQFQHPRLVEDVARALDETGMDPSKLSLEVTESLMVHDRELAVAKLKGLRQLGPQLAVDDFGVGYSGLRYLRDFPVNTLKIDRVFVADIHRDAYNSAIVRSVVALAQALGLRVTAEGIETEAERQHVIELGCYGGQGYLFGRPMSAAAFFERLAGEPASARPAKAA
jgi:diguanylate cyclase (GGDEF)-like protein